MAKLSREEYLAERASRVEQLTENMADRVAMIATGPEARDLVEFAAQFRGRSPRNAMLIYQQWEARCQAQEDPAQRPEQPSMIAGYKQFQAMGRQVKKGEKGYQILSPVTGRFASATPSDADSWRRLAPREKPNPGEKVGVQDGRRQAGHGVRHCPDGRAGDSGAAEVGAPGTGRRPGGAARGSGGRDRPRGLPAQRVRGWDDRCRGHDELLHQGSHVRCEPRRRTNRSPRCCTSWAISSSTHPRPARTC